MDPDTLLHLGVAGFLSTAAILSGLVIHTFRKNGFRLRDPFALPPDRPAVPIATAPTGPPAKRVNTVKEGEAVEVVGRVRVEPNERLLHAPLSGRPCVAWHLQVVIDDGRDQVSAILLDELESGRILVSDPTGVAEVAADTPVVVMAAFDRSELALADGRLLAPLADYCAAHDIPQARLLGQSGTVRVREGVIEEGERVAVAGTATWRQVSRNESYRDRSRRKRLFLGPLPVGTARITDDANLVSRSARSRERVS